MVHTNTCTHIHKLNTSSRSRYSHVHTLILTVFQSSKHLSMDSYDHELERAAKELESIPRKLSESNIKALGIANHFETFEDDLHDVGSTQSKGKRLSLSGSIIVIDFDFTSADIIESVSLSLSQEAKVVNSSAFSKQNNPEKRIIETLGESRLDKFSRLLSFLSRCDRFSTKDVNCFNALDLVSEAIHTYVSSHGNSKSFGELVLNPTEQIGLGLKYHKDYLCMIDAVPGNRKQFNLRNFKEVSDWIDPETGEWIKELPEIDYEARSELALTLDPPIILPEPLVTDWQALVSNPAPDLNERINVSSFSVQRHPKFSTPTNRSDDFSVSVGNMLPVNLLEVSQIPLSKPSDIPDILLHLRQYAVIAELLRSVLQGPEVGEAADAVDISISDALELQDQTVHRKRVPLAVSFFQNSKYPDMVTIDVDHVLSDLKMQINVDRDGSCDIKISPENSRYNLSDVEKLIGNGDLAFAVSYIFSAHGRLRRSSSVSMSN